MHQDQMSPDFLTMLEQMSPEQVQAMLEPYSQEQGVLDQQMALAQQLRKPQDSGQHVTPLGAALGGLSNAVGNVGGAYMQHQGLNAQTALGGRMQQDASGRLQALMDLLKKGRASEAGPDAADPYAGLSPAEEM